MSNRSQERRITSGARTLKFLRQQAKLSFRTAANASGMNSATINHLEHGRIQIHPHHLQKLLSAYGVNIQTFEMLSSGSVPLPQDVRAECLEMVRLMPLEQLRLVHPVLISFASHK